MEFKITSTNTKRIARSRASGSALIELMISLVISALVLAQVCVIWFYSSRAFVSQLNYVDMDQRSQRTLDLLSREIRNTKSLLAFTATKVDFKDYDGATLTYQFAEQELRRFKNGTKTVLLKGCDSGSFSIFQRNPVEGKYDQYPTATPATCKLVEVKWKCKRKLMPSAPETKESMHSAKIVIRSNDP